MNKLIYFIGGIIATMIIGVAFMASDNTKLGGVPQVPSFTSATSIVKEVGHQANTSILSAKGTRAYASICNNGANKGYVYLYATTTLATTSASVPLASGSCYVINQDNLYTGAVGYVQETATTTSLFVVELAGY